MTLKDVHQPQKNGTSRFAVSVPRERNVDLSIHDLSGRTVGVLHHGMLVAGEHRFEWTGTMRSGAPANSGVYFVSFRSEGATQVRRLLLVR